MIAPGGLAEIEKEVGDAAQKVGFVVLGLVLAFSICLFWRCCVCCKERRERRMMQLASARADNVLGDMQVGSTVVVPGGGAESFTFPSVDYSTHWS
jgi:hypothetical protein